MTLRRSLFTVAITTLICTAVGIGASAALGRCCPDYYKLVFRVRGDAELDPVQIGVGFGLNAGVFTGVFLGVILTGMLGYFEMRIRLARINADGLDPSSEQPLQSR